jgi:hypothetical protein
MTALKAHVENGRVVLDEPMDLPDGTVLRVVAVADGDDLDDEERDELHAAILEGLEDMKAGRTYAATDVIAELRSRSMNVRLSADGTGDACSRVVQDC